MEAILVSTKVSVSYSKIKKNFPKSSQRFYLAQTLIKHKKQTTDRKQNLSKTEQSVVIWIKRILLEPQKF